MKTQPHPEIQQEDINRIVRRDFPESQVDIVLDMLGEYGSETWHRESSRVKAAILKLANGKLPALRTAMEAAKRDYRDLILAAEFPEYGRRSSSSARTLEGAERDLVIDRDWNQYKAWLEKS